MDPTPENNSAVPPPAEESGVKSEASAVPHIALKVINADGGEMLFRIKTTTPLKKLFDTYCKKNGVSRQSVRFLYDGAPVDESKTPQELDLQEEDVIDAMVEQTGGCISV